MPHILRNKQFLNIFIASQYYAIFSLLNKIRLLFAFEFLFPVMINSTMEYFVYRLTYTTEVYRTTQ